MARKPIEFETHPASFSETQGRGLMRAAGEHVVDGDTFDVLIDLGFNSYGYETIRLRGVDTPEIYRPEDDDELARGQEAKAFVEDLVEQKPLLVRSYKDRTSFGRFTATVWVEHRPEWDELGLYHSVYTSEAVWVSLGEVLFETGYTEMFEEKDPHR